MMIYIGFSRSLTADELRALLDIDPDHPEGKSKVEQEFAASYIGSGDFEVYGREDTENGFNRDEINELLPFEPGELILFGEGMAEFSAVFFVQNDEDWAIRESLGIIVTDVLPREEVRFNFE